MDDTPSKGEMPAGKGRVDDAEVQPNSVLHNGKRNGEGGAGDCGGVAARSADKGEKASATPQHQSVPAGIPARGPAVLYRCRVLHGTGGDLSGGFVS